MSRILTLLSILSVVFSNRFDELAAVQNEQWLAIPHSEIASNFSIFKHAGICTLKSTIYIHGGLNEEEELMDTFVQIDLVTMTASNVTLAPNSPAPLGRRKHFLLADESNDHLYLLGGKDTDDISPWKFNTQTGVWTQLSHDAPNYIDENIEDTDYSVTSLPGYLVVAGSKDGLSGDYLVYAKETDVWHRKPSNTEATHIEDPVLVSYLTKAYIIGGSTQTQYLPNRTVVIDLAGGIDGAVWEELTGPPGEEFQGFSMGELIGVVGEPGGKGILAANNGIAMVNVTEGGNWTYVTQGDVWPPLSTDIRITSYHNKVILLGALIGEGFPSKNMWVFDPNVCPKQCSSNGVCKMGNCHCAKSFSGIACEVEEKNTNLTPMITGVVVGGTVFSLLAIALVWKQTTKMREYRKLYSTSRIAEDMASQIARMELEQLDYLMHIQHPTSTQQSFQTIVESLKLYRSYLPESLLQRDSDGESDAESHTAKSHKSLSRISSSGASTSDTASRKEYQTGVVGVALTRGLNKLSIREVAVLRTVISQKKTEDSDRRVPGHLKITKRTEGSYKGLIDSIQQAVQSTRGSIITLDGDVVTSAWNFNLQTAIPSTNAAATAFKIGVDVDDFHVRHAVTNKSGYCGTLGGTKLRSPVLVGPHVNIVQLLHKISVHRSLPVLTDLRELSSSYGLKPVDIIASGGYLSCSGPVSPTDAMVEVYTIVEQNSQGNEWMYELDAINAHNEKIFEAMDIYKRSGAVPTLQMINGVTESDQPQLRLLKETIETAGSLKLHVLH